MEQTFYDCSTDGGSESGETSIGLTVFYFSCSRTLKKIYKRILNKAVQSHGYTPALAHLKSKFSGGSDGRGDFLDRRGGEDKSFFELKKNLKI